MCEPRIKSSEERFVDRVRDLKAKIAAQAEEIERLKEAEGWLERRREKKDLENLVGARGKYIEDLKEDLAAQAQALKRYGRHDRQCGAIFDPTLPYTKNPPVAADCNCGFSKALGEI